MRERTVLDNQTWVLIGVWVVMGLCQVAYFAVMVVVFASAMLAALLGAR